MNKIIRNKYADYIAAAMRYAEKTTWLKWPNDIILITHTYSELSETDKIIGMKIFVCDIPSSFDFFIAFPSEYESNYKLHTAFLEYLELYPFQKENDE